MGYLAILKGKRGEFSALSTVPVAQRAGVRPCIEIVPPPTDRKITPTPGAFIDETIDRVAGSWGAAGPVLIDLRVSGFGDLIAVNLHPWTRVQAAAVNYGVPVVPVVTLTDSAARLAASGALCNALGNGAAIRLTWAQCLPLLAGGAQALGMELDRVAAALGVARIGIDVIVDQATIDVPVAQRSTELQQIVAAMPNLATWRSVTVAGTSMPAVIGNLGFGTIPVPRYEWDAWTALRGQAAAGSTPIDFGDYVAAAPDLPPPGGRTRHPALRYTVGSEVVVIRRQAAAGAGLGGFRDICQHVVGPNPPPYAGAGYSWGDAAIAAVAAGQQGSGNAELWRRIAVSHHLAVVADQLPGLPWP